MDVIRSVVIMAVTFFEKAVVYGEPSMHFALDRVELDVSFRATWPETRFGCVQMWM